MAKQNGFNRMYAYECIEGMEWNRKVEFVIQSVQFQSINVFINYVTL